MNVGVSDFLVEKLLHRSLGLGRDLLRLVADVQHRNVGCKARQADAEQLAKEPHILIARFDEFESTELQINYYF